MTSLQRLQVSKEVVHVCLLVLGQQVEMRGQGIMNLKLYFPARPGMIPTIVILDGNAESILVDKFASYLFALRCRNGCGLWYIGRIEKPSLQIGGRILLRDSGEIS